MGAPIVREVGRRDGRGHGVRTTRSVRAAGRRSGAEDAGKGGFPLEVILPILRMSLLLLLWMLLLRLPRRRHPVSLVVGHVACQRLVCQPAERVAFLVRVH